MTSYETDSKLVSFLYTLLRDELPAGVVERLVRDAEVGEKVTLTNGDLARYAVELADRLSNPEYIYDVIVRGRKYQVTASKFGVSASEIMALALEMYGPSAHERNQEWEMLDSTGRMMISGGTGVGPLDGFQLPFYINLRPGWGG